MSHTTRGPLTADDAAHLAALAEQRSDLYWGPRPIRCNRWSRECWSAIQWSDWGRQHGWLIGDR